MEPNDKKVMPHREYESTFELLSPEQRRAELSVYELIFGTRPKGPIPSVEEVKRQQRRVRKSKSVRSSRIKKQEANRG